MDWGKRRRNKPMKTKSGLNFLGLMREEGGVSLVTGRLMSASNF